MGLLGYIPIVRRLLVYVCYIIKRAAAEGAINILLKMARTMMLHADLIFPDRTIKPELFPMSIGYAVWIYNHIPNPWTGLYPIEIWYDYIFEPVSKTLYN